MFSYYGCKSKIVKKYPEPLHDLIIEPFAGSARYALEYWDRAVTLVEAYDKVYRVWKYLQQASEAEIRGLPDVEPKQKLGTVMGFSQLCDEAKWLIGFSVNSGSSIPKKTAGKRNHWHRDRERIASTLYKIRHWNIRFGDFTDLENVTATWYIDPPYQKAGKYYTKRLKDYTFLGIWCQSRQGQVIVCENEDADWLDFQPLTTLAGQLHTQKEVIWYREANFSMPVKLEGSYAQL